MEIKWSDDGRFAYAERDELVAGARCDAEGHYYVTYYGQLLQHFYGAWRPLTPNIEPVYRTLEAAQVQIIDAVRRFNRPPSYYAVPPKPVVVPARKWWQFWR